jgi:hypothetical protein
MELNPDKKAQKRDAASSLKAVYILKRFCPLFISVLHTVPHSLQDLLMKSPGRVPSGLAGGEASGVT